MTNPFFLIMNCIYEDKGDELVVYWRWSPNTVIYPTKNPAHLVGKTVWCFRDELKQLKTAGLTMNKIEPGSIEYFYQTKDLGELAGASLKKMRNKINKFRTEHPHEIKTSCPPEEAKALIHSWYKKTVAKKEGYHKETLQFEYESSLTMIDLLPSMTKVEQLAFYAQKKLIGYTLYCPLYDDFWVSIIQKTEIRYRNLAKLMYHEKCKRMLQYPYATFGDDGTDPSLAAAKRDLHPYKEELSYTVECGPLKS